MKKQIILSASFALLATSVAQAATTQPPSAFQTQVQQNCLSAASALFRRPKIAVDPIGSDSFGIAIVYGRSSGGDGATSVVCIMDKKTGRIELGSELSPDIIRIKKPKPLDANGNPLPNRKKRMQDQTQPQGQVQPGNQTQQGDQQDPDTSTDDDQQ